MSNGAIYETWTDGNVVHLHFLDGPTSPRPVQEAHPLAAGASGEAEPGRQGLRWRLAHSPAAVDLRAHADVIGVVLGLVLAVVLCTTTPLIDLVHRLIGALT